MTDVTFVDDFLVEVAVAETRVKRDLRQMNMKPPQKMTFSSDREDEDLAPAITVSRSGWPIRHSFHFRLEL